MTVVGVAAAGFSGPELGAAADLWLPVGAAGMAMPGFAAEIQRRDSPVLRVVGRLRPTASPESASEPWRRSPGAWLRITPRATTL